MLCAAFVVASPLVRAVPTEDIQCTPVQGSPQIEALCSTTPQTAACFHERGLAYEFGSVGTEDPRRAAVCYQAAINLGNVQAKGHLGYLHWQGIGVKADIEKAVPLISAAAEAGFPRAQTNLAVMYWNGEGVAQDLDLAAQWLELGVEAGNRLAKRLFPKLREQRLNIALRDSVPAGIHPLLHGAVTNNTNIVQQYIDIGADLDQMRNVSQLTALALAVANGNYEVAELLLQNGADINTRMDDGSPLLTLTVEDRDLAAVNWVLRAKADASAQTDDGFTAMQVAIQHGYIEKFRAMADFGVNLEDPGGIGLPPLVSATGHEQEEIVIELLNRGVNINAQTSDGSTALHYAVSNDLESITELLLKSCARVDIKDDEQRTPVSIARIGGNQSVVRLLKSAGKTCKR